MKLLGFQLIQAASGLRNAIAVTVICFSPSSRLLLVLQIWKEKMIQTSKDHSRGRAGGDFPPLVRQIDRLHASLWLRSFFVSVPVTRVSDS
jgi:hypothetical protein